MSFKTITVHIEGSDRCAARVSVAGLLAMQFAGEVSGIAPTGVPDVLLDLNVGALDGAELIALATAGLRDRAQAAALTFDEQCRGRGLKFQSRVVVSEAVDAVIEFGRISDLIVVGQTDRSRRADGVAFDFPQQVLLHAGPPVLVVPHAGVFDRIGRSILVAWKGTREATNALRSALPLIRAADSVTLMEIGGSAGRPCDDTSLLLAKVWLGSHGVACDARTEPDLGSIGDQLLSRAADIGADLVVSGGYGHSRLREWVLGGVTKHLLEYMTVPTLLAH